MIRNYFKIALRNIRRNATYSILNVLGMAIGMACALLIILWIKDEWSYDRHFRNADHLYRVIEKQRPEGGEEKMYAPSPSPLSTALKAQFTEIIRATRFVQTPLTLKKGEENIEENVTVVDPDFLTMFDVDFIQGDSRTALNDPYSIILTEESAIKYFGNKNALGKKLASLGFDLTVTGIVKKLPENSHISFDKIISIDLFVIMGANDINEWNRGRCYNYIELSKGTDRKSVEKKLMHFLDKFQEQSNSLLSLQNVQDIHLYSARKYTYDVAGLGDIMYVKILTLVVVFIILIACVNFMNLSTAQSVQRAKEIGIQKISGASRKKVVFQFLGESLLLVFTAHIIAMIMVELLLPSFSNLAGKHLEINYQSWTLYAGLFLMVLFCSLLAGSYPAFYLSRLKPVYVLKGSANNFRSIHFRRALVIFQFTLSVLLILCTIIIKGQFNYLQNKDLGFNKDHMGYFLFPTFPDDPKLISVKEELLKIHGIESVTRANNNPFNVEWMSDGVSWRNKMPGSRVNFYMISADADYARTYQLKMKEGRFFDSGKIDDAAAVIINETAAEIMNLSDPLTETISCNGSDYQIIGVVRDFNFKPLHYKIEPLIMQLGNSNTFYCRMKSNQPSSIINDINRVYESYNPANAINFHFLDADFDYLYRTEQKMSRIFSYFSILAIIISCLGLIGLSSFIAEKRTKEIGIRKTHGAKSMEILSLLFKEFIVLAGIAVVIASPVALFAMNKWLQNFAYRIHISWWVFALTAAIVLLITMFTIGYQSYKASFKNPVDALRYE